MNRNISLLLVFLILVTILSGFINALSIDSQSSFSENTQWNFIVNFDTLQNGESGEVFVDNQKVISVFQYNNQVFIDESTVSSKVISFKINNKSITVSFVGLSRGNKEILVKRISGENVINEVSKDIEFVEVVTKSEQDILKSEINNLQSQMSSLEKNIISKDEQISQLQRENSKLISDLENLNANIRLLEQDGKSKDEILFQVKEDLNILLVEREEARKSPLNGLFVFGSENSSLIFVLLLLVALVMVGVFIKSRKTSIYDSPIFDNGDDYSYKEIKTESSENSNNKFQAKPSLVKDFFVKNFGKKEVRENVENDGKGKWATESYFPDNNQTKLSTEEKKFDLGDLVKK